MIPITSNKNYHFITQKQIVLNKSLSSGQGLGRSVFFDKVSEDYFVATDQSSTGNTEGFAYIYFWTGDNWVLYSVAKLSYLAASNHMLGGKISGNSLITTVTNDSLNSYGCMYYSIKKNLIDAMGAWNIINSTVSNPINANTRWGGSIDISQDASSVVVGAPLNDINATNTGSAYIYKLSAGSYILSYTIDGLAANARLGYSVAMSGDGNRVVIAIPLAGTNGLNSGSIAIYKYTTSWTLETYIHHPDSIVDGNFGCSVAMSKDGDRILIGASGGISGSGGTTKAYVLVYSGSWGLEGTLNMPVGDSPNSAIFGASVGMSKGNVAVVSASGYANTGRAYVYRKVNSTWSYEATLANPAPVAGDLFGDCVSLSDSENRIIVGASGAEGSIGNIHAFHYIAGGWPLVNTLHHPNPTITEDPGVAISYAVAISYSTDLQYLGISEPTNNQVLMYYRPDPNSQWKWLYTIPNVAPVASSDLFGNKICLSSNASRVLIGSVNKNSYAGAVYTFLKSSGTWNLELTVTGTSNFGTDLVASADCTRMAVSDGTDATKIYLRGASWAQEGATLTGEGNILSMTADATRLAIAAPFNGSGTVVVYSRSGTNWTKETTTALSSAYPGFGSAISIASSGDRLAIVSGGGGANLNVRIHIYLRTGSSWTQETILDLGVSGAFNLKLIALDALGDKLFFTLPSMPGGVNSSQWGALFCYRRIETVWVKENTIYPANTLDAPQEANISFGRGLGISQDASEIAVSQFFLPQVNIFTP